MSKHLLFHYWAINRNKILKYAITWVNLENLVLSERSQSQKAIYCRIVLPELFRMGRSIGTESRLVTDRRWVFKGGK